MPGFCFNGLRVMSIGLVLAPILTLAQAPPAMAKAAVAASAPAAYQRQIVSLTTDDSSTAPAMLTTPAGGMNPAGPAIIHLHGGPGTGILAAGGPKISAGFAARGYTVLSPLLRQGSSPLTMDFKTVDLDIKAAVDYLQAHGFRDIILTGSSLGSICVTRYLVDTQDKRIKADVHFTPTADLYRQTPKPGSDPTAFAARAEAVREISLLVNQNHGQDTVVSNLGHNHLAKVWLDLWGPQSTANNSALIGQIRQPTLLIWGDRDNANVREDVDRLKALAVSAKTIDLRVYPGANHILDPSRDQIIADVATWLTGLGYGPKPAFDTEVVDINGVLSDTAPYAQPALRLTPRGTAKSDTALILIHDWNDEALTGPSRWLGPALAQAGHTVFVINDQRGQNEQLASRFALSDQAIGVYVAHAHAQGFKRVILVGHGYGALRAAHYAADAKLSPVAGVAALAPVQAPASWMRALLGADAYAADVTAAQDRVARNDKTLVQFVSDKPAPAPFTGRIKLAMQPASFLDTWGPDAPDLEKALSSVRQPVLIIGGSQDPLADQSGLRRAGRAASKAEVEWYGGEAGASHDLSGYQDRTIADVIAWLNADAR